MKKLFSILTIALITSGCATMFNGSQQEVSFKTKPEGLVVQTPNNSCVSPCKMSIQRSSRNYRVTEPVSQKYVEYTFQRTVNPSSYLNFFNYGIGYLLIDMQEGGGAYKIEDVEIDVTPFVKAHPVASSTKL